MSGEAGEELDTPAARIMARRESRAAMPDRLKVAAPDDSSDEEWNGDDDEDEEEDGRVYLDASKCGRVRLHAVQGPAQSSSGLGWGWTTNGARAWPTRAGHAARWW